MALVVVACAWCGRVRATSGGWEAAEIVDLNSPDVTHGICPECLDLETRSWRASPLLDPVAASH